MGKSSVSVEIPKYLAYPEKGVDIVRLDGDSYGFAGQMTRRAYQAKCGQCGGESTLLWLPAAFCPFCGAELEGEPELQWMAVDNPFDLEADKPNHNELRESLRDAIRSFLQCAVDAE